MYLQTPPTHYYLESSGRAADMETHLYSEQPHCPWNGTHDNGSHHAHTSATLFMVFSVSYTICKGPKLDA